MVESITSFFIENLGEILSKETIVFLVSLLPIIELRGGIITGYLLGIDFLPTFFIAFLGNIVPIPFILFFIKIIFKFLKRTPLRKIVSWCERKAEEKNETIKKYAYLGLIIFVGIPLPGTGAWTGALIASTLNMDIKKTFLAISLGVLLAGIIISILSFGILDSLL